MDTEENHHVHAAIYRSDTMKADVLLDQEVLLQSSSNIQ